MYQPTPKLLQTKGSIGKLGDGKEPGKVIAVSLKPENLEIETKTEKETKKIKKIDEKKTIEVKTTKKNIQKEKTEKSPKKNQEKEKEKKEMKNNNMKNKHNKSNKEGGKGGSKGPYTSKDGTGNALGDGTKNEQGVGTKENTMNAIVSKIQAKIIKHWFPPEAFAARSDIIIEIEIHLDKTGTITGYKLLDPKDDFEYKAVAASVIRTINDPQVSPLPIENQKIDCIILKFCPKDVL